MADEAIQEMLKMFDERELIVALERRELIKQFHLMRRVDLHDQARMNEEQARDFKRYVEEEMADQLGREILGSKQFVDVLVSRNYSFMTDDIEMSLSLLVKPSLYL